MAQRAIPKGEARNLLRIYPVKRSKIPPKQSKKIFSSTAAKTHKKNVAGVPMRGGIRL